jgi:hypothetical protein
MSRTLLSPRTFREKPLQEQKDLQTINFSNWRGYRQEDISPRDKLKLKKKQMIELEKLLKNHDYYYVYANGRAYDKGRDESEEIELLVREIDTADGKKDALKLYRKYLKKHESKKPSEAPEINESKMTTKDYMNPSSWFPAMTNVKSTGSLNGGEADERIPDGESGVSHISNQDVLYSNVPHYVYGTARKLKDMESQRKK